MQKKLYVGGLSYNTDADQIRDRSDTESKTLAKAFSEITGIRATPSHAQTRCWPEAQTQVPIGASQPGQVITANLSPGVAVIAENTEALDPLSRSSYMVPQWWPSQRGQPTH